MLFDFYDLYYFIELNFFEFLNPINFMYITNFIIFYYLINPIILIFSIKLTIKASIMFTTKFVILISLLVFVRGGIPRYRYDFLTKIGWIKYLSLVFSFFLITLFSLYIL